MTNEIRVTDEMIEAGADIISASIYFEGHPSSAEEMALEVYRSMVKLLDSHCKTDLKVALRG